MGVVGRLDLVLDDNAPAVVGLGKDVQGERADADFLADKV